MQARKKCCMVGRSSSVVGGERAGRRYWRGIFGAGRGLSLFSMPRLREREKWEQACSWWMWRRNSEGARSHPFLSPHELLPQPQFFVMPSGQISKGLGRQSRKQFMRGVRRGMTGIWHWKGPIVAFGIDRAHVVRIGTLSCPSVSGRSMAKQILWLPFLPNLPQSCARSFNCDIFNTNRKRSKITLIVILRNSDLAALIISLSTSSLSFLSRARQRISRRASARTIPSAATFRGRKRTGSGTTGGRPCSSAATLTIAREYPTMPASAGERRSTHLAKVLKSPAFSECHLDLNRRVVDKY